MAITQIKKGELYELSPAAEKELEASKYYNADLAPTKIKDRTWTTKDVADLWIGLSVSIPALALASSLVALGVSPLLAIINVILGNLIVLVPIQLNSHVGTKYGIPYPIYARLTFGTKGAQLSSISRSIIGCGWTSVQSWVGGGAVAALIGIVFSYFSDQSQTIALPGNDSVVVGQFIGFIIFVLICGWVAYTGMDKIKFVQNFGGPLLIVVVAALMIWSIMTINASGHSVMDVFSEGNNAVNMLKLQTKLIDLSRKVVVIRAKAMLDERHDAITELWHLKSKLDDLIEVCHEMLKDVAEKLVHDGKNINILTHLQDLQNLDFEIEADDSLFMERIGIFCDKWLEITDRIVEETRVAFEELSNVNM